MSTAPPLRARSTLRRIVPTDEEVEIRAAVRGICESLGGPEYHRRIVAADEPPRELWDALAEKGYLGVNLPERYGGGGLGMHALQAVGEEISAAGCSLLLIVVSPAIVGSILTRHGTEAQREDWLPGIAAGTTRVAFAITEPDAGTNSHNLSTAAARQERALDGAGRQLERPAIAGGLRRPADAPQEVGARGVQVHVVVEPLDSVDRVEPGLRALRHRDRDGAVQLDDGRGLRPQQPVVEVADPRPAGVLGAARGRVLDGDRRLQRVRAGRARRRRAARAERPPGQRDALGDLLAVPARAVLVLRAARSRRPRRRARRGGRRGAASARAVPATSSSDGIISRRTRVRRIASAQSSRRTSSSDSAAAYPSLKTR